MENEICLYKECFTEEECSEYFNDLNKLEWRQVKWKTGKFLPRRVFKPFIGLPLVLKKLRDEVEMMLECTVLDVWCNHYKDGSEYTPSHQDTYGKWVVTLSFGATRDCVTQNIKTSEKSKYLLENGDILVFSPVFDAYNKHSIPKTKKCTDPRISVVFFTTPPQLS
jgi:alkylated DNA repair dioxygenase AlkB